MGRFPPLTKLERGEKWVIYAVLSSPTLKFLVALLTDGDETT